jgi:hypothetical protein
MEAHLFVVTLRGRPDVVVEFRQVPAVSGHLEQKKENAKLRIFCRLGGFLFYVEPRPFSSLYVPAISYQ